MALRKFLLNGVPVVTLLMASGVAEAQTTYALGGGTVTYTGPAPNMFRPNAYDVATDSAADSGVTRTVTVTGVTIAQSTPDDLALLIDQNDIGPLAVTFAEAPSSITSKGDALDVYHVGFTETGDVSLDTSGTTGGNVFSAGGHGYGVDFENDIGPFSTGSVILGADTISSVNGDGLHAYSGSGSLSVTSAANITSTGAYGISAIANNVLSVTLSGSVSGAQGSVSLYSLGQSSLTLQTGATLTGDALGSQYGAGSALIVAGHGTAANNFVNFNTMEVQDSGGGTWSLKGTSSFSGGLQVDAGGSLSQDAGANTFQSVTNAGTISVNANTFTATGLFTNSGTLEIAAGAKLTVGTFTQTAGSTLINGGTLDPAAINVQGGTFGGTGTVVGNLNVTGGTIKVGASPDSLVVHGNYGQSGGIITFEVDPNGSGGFLESSLVLDAGSTLTINGTQIVFDFVGGADPLAFLNSGMFNLDTFFKSSSGNPFSNDFNLGNVFGGDSFGITAPGFDITNFIFDPSKGALGLEETSVAGVPEPDVWAMMLAGFGGIGFMMRGSRRKASLR